MEEGGHSFYGFCYVYKKNTKTHSQIYPHLSKIYLIAIYFDLEVQSVTFFC